MSTDWLWPVAIVLACFGWITAMVDRKEIVMGKGNSNQVRVSVLADIGWVFDNMRRFFEYYDENFPVSCTARRLLDCCRKEFIEGHYDGVNFILVLHGKPAADKPVGSGLVLSLQEIMDAMNRQINTLDHGSGDYRILHGLLRALYAYFGCVGCLEWRRYVRF